MNDERRQQIVEAARQLYEEQGLSRTSVKDISDRCAMTRSLFYHYFPDKQAVTSAVLDDYIADYIESLTLWDSEREVGNIEDALAGVVKVMRLGVFEGRASAGRSTRRKTPRCTWSSSTAWPTARRRSSSKRRCETTRRCTR